MEQIQESAPAERRTEVVYTYDPVSLRYMGTTLADESPEEPGLFHVPAYALEEEPPEPPEGYEVIKGPSGWVVRQIPLEAAAPPVQATPGLSPEELTTQETARQVIGAETLVREILDGVARTRGYDGILAAASYAEEPAVPAYQEEGRIFRRWRSLMWGAAYAVIDAAKASGTWPTANDFVAGLPTFADAAGVVYLAPTEEENGAPASDPPADTTTAPPEGGALQ